LAARDGPADVQFRALLPDGHPTGRSVRGDVHGHDLALPGSNSGLEQTGQGHANRGPDRPRFHDGCHDSLLLLGTHSPLAHPFDRRPIAVPSPRGSAPPVKRWGLPFLSYSMVRPWALPRRLTCTLWPRAVRALRTLSGTPSSTAVISGSTKLRRPA